jgi:hypothetical protein
MGSWQNIANMALFRLGSNPLVNYETQTGIAPALCREFMQRAVNDVLLRHHWTCAKGRQRLAALTDKPEGEEWEYQYQLPVGPRCLQVRKTEPDSPWEKMGTVLLSNESELVLIYTKEITNPAELDDELDTPISLRLACLIGPKLAGTEPSTITTLEVLYEKELLEARGVNAANARKKAKDDSATDWLEVG